MRQAPCAALLPEVKVTDGSAGHPTSSHVSSVGRRRELRGAPTATFLHGDPTTATTLSPDDVEFALYRMTQWPPGGPGDGLPRAAPPGG
jgi:hypothetical protein